MSQNKDSRDPTLTVFPETITDLDILKEHTGATKKWILRDLVRKEVQRLQGQKSKPVEAVVR